jgi:FAD/FMN-containing dehydrogenase/ferredoxin
MHIQNEGVGRAIYPGNATPAPPPTAFSPKPERAENKIASELAALNLKDVRVASASGERMLYSRDQSEIPKFMKDILFDAQPEVVVHADSLEAVIAVVRFAASKGLPIIPRGSGSSPFGGSVPVTGGIVVDTSGMDKIVSIDIQKKTARVEAGVRWADLDHELEKKGLAINTSPSSKFSTVAGWISTGGMGLNSLSKGHLSWSVLEVDIVTPDGSKRTISKGDLMFPAVFGSEGQLGIITSATMSVREMPEKSRPHILFFDDSKSALSFAHALAKSDVHPAHIVFESASKFRYVNRALGQEHFKESDAILINLEGDESERLFEAFLKGTGLTEEKEYLARYMWNERFFPMKVRKYGPGMLGSEVVVPLRILPDALAKTADLCADIGLSPLFEVHFLSMDNGLLLTYYITDQGNTIGYALDAVKSMMLTSMLIDLGARPYSIGIWNYPFSNAEEKARMEQMKAAKSALDPRGLMNPGKYFTLSGRFGGAAGMFFNPSFMRPALKTMRVFSPLTNRVMRMGYDFAERKLRPKSRTELMKVADECAMCGACVSVCPAYLVVGDERVTGRGKLLTVKAMARGANITKEHSDRMFLCTRCKACEQVCQSKLELVKTYESLEKELETMYGKDAAEIERFVKYTEGLPEYDKLIERGLVSGAPKHGMGGGSADI